jgi:hypothetical protein
MAWLDNKNAVLADTCYCDNQLAAKDVSVNLPAVTFLTSEVNAMGKMDVILPGLIEAMEASVTKVGLDTGLSKMLTPTKHNFELRWAQNVLKSDGTTEPEGCKAFITGVPKGVPATGLESAATSRARSRSAALAISCLSTCGDPLHRPTQSDLPHQRRRLLQQDRERTLI